MPLLAGAAALVNSFLLGIGSLTEPGAGLWPAGASCMMILGSVILLASWRSIDDGERFGGAILENSFRQSLRMFSGDILGFVERPIAGTLVALIALVIAAPVAMRLLRPGTKMPLAPPDPAQLAAPPPGTPEPPPPPAQARGADQESAKAVTEETDS